jgi:hypothetical protein
MVDSKVWTERRKMMGNVLPALVWLPFVGAGLIMMGVSGEMLGPGLWLLICGNIMGWLALDSLGLYQNDQMRDTLRRMLETREEPPADGSIFVGFSTPRYHGLLDAHEDVGFLRMLPDKLVFVSESRTVELAKTDVRTVRFRPNVHSLVGLGRWVSLEGEHEGKTLRMLVEPRERSTMLGNFRYAKELRRRLAAWAKTPAV